MEERTLLPTSYISSSHKLGLDMNR